MVRIEEVLAWRQSCIVASAVLSKAPLASLPILHTKSPRSVAGSQVLSLRFSTGRESSAIRPWRSDSRTTRSQIFTTAHCIIGAAPARVARDGVTPAESNIASEDGVARATGPVASDLRAESARFCDDRSDVPTEIKL